GVKTVHLVGGSWGSITTALYVSTGGADRVSRLVLYAPIFAAVNDAWVELLRDAEIPGLFGRHWAACRIVDEASVRARWDAEIPDGQIDQWRDEAAFQALVQSTLADDPESQNHHSRSFRAPNGTFVDLWEAFNARPLYDPSNITCPTLLIRGSADPTSTRRDALALFEALGATEKTYVEIANGAHFVSAERRAPQVFAAVNAFLTA
ncbi:MAG: alpha/beta fold hydrolase, partial [Pseudomonadota bacterium]